MWTAQPLPWFALVGHGLALIALIVRAMSQPCVCYLKTHEAQDLGAQAKTRMWTAQPLPWFALIGHGLALIALIVRAMSQPYYLKKHAAQNLGTQA